MSRKFRSSIAAGLLLGFISTFAFGQAPVPAETGDEDVKHSTEAVEVSDPLEPVNRLFFKFNDKLYFWILKPVAKGYKTVTPHVMRVGIGNFFGNLQMPVRAVNCTLQGDLEGTATELTRFMVNSTWGIAGLRDPARNQFDIAPCKEDTGQTLGRYGIGSGIFINWPVFGPSNVRDTFGRVGDMLLDPITYVDPSGARYVLRGTDRVNSTSLRLGDYEEFKAGALDPYISLRDAYEQYRRRAVEK
ncbi:MAG: VacJ family lipoprotein [Lentisphaeria bacterium]